MPRLSPRRPTFALSVLLALVPMALSAPPASADDAGLIARLTDGVTLPGVPAADPAVPSPATFLGYALGERFTPYHRIVAYLERLAEVSDRVELKVYGETYEGRPLLLLAVTDPRHGERLDALRRGNLDLSVPAERTSAEREALLADQPVVVWLAYGVHGNESSSAEAAMATAYTLAAAGGEVADWLSDAIVLIDPLSNPDGRERYVGWFRSVRGRRPNGSPDALEHREPWPGGRQNHYLIDLNRDWAWATQLETRARLAVYRRWEPQVYVDFHEMRPTSTYFFPPSAEPVHPEFGPLALSWLEVFGDANAAAFDRHGWPYFVGEVYDLFYPGYGDSYPSLRGAVGMTYEMAGGGTAGQWIELADGRRLSLADRIARHYTTGLATVRTAVAHRRELLRDFALRRAPSGAQRTYLWSAKAAEAEALAALLEEHGVAIGELAEDVELTVRPLAGERAVRRRFVAGTRAVTTAQPLGSLLRVLMEAAGVPDDFAAAQRRRVLADRHAQFYDVTAWSLPMAFNVEVWAFDGKPETRPISASGAATGHVSGRGGLGHLIVPQGLAGFRLVAALLAAGERPRLALSGFRNEGREFPAGTLFLPSRSSRVDIERLADELGVRLERVATSKSDRGPSLGSNEMRRVGLPRIGLVGGRDVSVTSHGAIWHLFDQGLALPHSRIDSDSLGEVDLGELDVLVLPDGRYRTLAGEAAERLGAWVRRGGVLVAIGQARQWLVDNELSAIEAWEAAEEVGDTAVPSGSEALIGRRALHTPGAILATEPSPLHALAIGMPAPPAVLFDGRRPWKPTGEPRVDVLRARSDDPVVAGFVWPEAEERLAGALLVATEEAGDGKVISFAAEPVYRLFWRATAPLFLNAVLYASSLDDF